MSCSVTLVGGNEWAGLEYAMKHGEKVRGGGATGDKSSCSSRRGENATLERNYSRWLSWPSLYLILRRRLRCSPRPPPRQSTTLATLSEHLKGKIRFHFNSNKRAEKTRRGKSATTLKQQENRNLHQKSIRAR
eukprot:757823-Hanusia_phi.AAC.2